MVEGLWCFGRCCLCDVKTPSTEIMTWRHESQREIDGGRGEKGEKGKRKRERLWENNHLPKAVSNLS